jgi:hypothetical protein
LGAIDLSGDGDVWVSGHTFSPDFPITPDAFDNVLGGDSEMFIMRLNDSYQIDYSSFIGGPYYPGNVSDMVFGDGENIWIFGTTYSVMLPI